MTLIEKKKKTFPGTNVFPNITDVSAHTLQDLGVMIICHLLWNIKYSLREYGYG